MSRVFITGPSPSTDQQEQLRQLVPAAKPGDRVELTTDTTTYTGRLFYTGTDLTYEIATATAKRASAPRKAAPKKKASVAKAAPKKKTAGRK